MNDVRMNDGSFRRVRHFEFTNSGVCFASNAQLGSGGVKQIRREKDNPLYEDISQEEYNTLWKDKVYPE